MDSHVGGRLPCAGEIRFGFLKDCYVKGASMKKEHDFFVQSASESTNIPGEDLESPGLAWWACMHIEFGFVSVNITIGQLGVCVGAALVARVSVGPCSGTGPLVGALAGNREVLGWGLPLAG